MCPAAVVKIKQSAGKLKQEIARMDVRAGVVAHMLLHAKLKHKSDISFHMHASPAV